MEAVAALHKYAAQLGFAARTARRAGVADNFTAPIFVALQEISRAVRPPAQCSPYQALAFARPSVCEAATILARIATRAEHNDVRGDAQQVEAEDPLVAADPWLQDGINGEEFPVDGGSGKDGIDGEEFYADGGSGKDSTNGEEFPADGGKVKDGIDGDEFYTDGGSDKDSIDGEEVYADGGDIKVGINGEEYVADGIDCEEFKEKEKEKELEKQQEKEQLKDQENELVAPIAPPIFEVRDWVVYNQRLVNIVRFGFGDYGGEVRVLFPHEDDRAWSAGRWVARSCIAPLRLPARFRTTCDMQSADDPAVFLPRDTHGILRSFDVDGDLMAVLYDGGSSRRVCIFMQDAGGLLLQELEDVYVESHRLKKKDSVMNTQ